MLYMLPKKEAKPSTPPSAEVIEAAWSEAGDEDRYDRRGSCLLEGTFVDYGWRGLGEGKISCAGGHGFCWW